MSGPNDPRLALELHDALMQAQARGPMTEAELKAQRFSWVYGEACIRAAENKGRAEGKDWAPLTDEDEAAVRAMVARVLGYDPAGGA